jgi:hypothetical protein
MTQDDYRRALDAAAREYEDLGARRREIDQRLAQLSQTIGTLTRLLGLTPTVPFGLTDAVRIAVRGAGVPVTPVEVRDRLVGFGFDMSKYANELAAVHTILKRLNDAGEVRFIPSAAGKHQYAWARMATPIVLTRDIVQQMYENAAEQDAARATEDPGPPRTRSRPRSRAPHGASTRRRTR